MDQVQALSADVRSLTIWQPWASLIAAGLKTIETRSWPTKYRGDLLIHAGRRVLPSDKLPKVPEAFSEHVADAPVGAIVAVVRLADVVPTKHCEFTVSVRTPPGWGDCCLGRPDCAAHIDRAQLPLGDFSRNRYAWLLSDIRPVRPIYVGGRQGLWYPDHDLQSRVADELSRSLEVA